jgi:hypothetical protein
MAGPEKLIDVALRDRARFEQLATRNGADTDIVALILCKRGVGFNASALLTAS